jgi:hypothetical protein
MPIYDYEKEWNGVLPVLAKAQFHRTNDKFGERTATGVESVVSKTAFPPL